MLSGVFVLAVAVNFIYFYPILTDHLLTNAEWQDRMWIDQVDLTVNGSPLRPVTSPDLPSPHAD